MSDFIHSLQPVHWLAIAVFIGASSISSAIYSLARELERRRWPKIKSDEAHALESIASLLVHIRDSMLKLSGERQ